jgi:hypothetical protein
MPITAFKRDVARRLVNHLCTSAAKLVHGAMKLNYPVIVAKHGMHVHCHMFRAATHQVG